MTIFVWIIQFIFVPALAPLFVGVIRKFKARLQGRNGASIIQPYFDLFKLFKKDEAISKDASWIFRVAPYIVFAVTLVVSASIPLFTLATDTILNSDILLIVYTLAIGTFFLALAGLDTGSSFGGFGSSREMTMSALAEAGFIFSLLTMAIIAGSANLFDIAGNVGLAYDNASLSLILSFSAFFIVLLAETSRFPFDNPATHLELTMIHEAMIIEYSGKRLAFMEWASANKLFLFVILAVNLFFPWGLMDTLEATALTMAVAVLLAKVLVLAGVIAVIETVMSKYRFFRLPDLLITAFILNVVAISLLNTI